MEMFDVTLLPAVGNLFDMNYEFSAKKYSLYCSHCWDRKKNHLLANKDFDLECSLIFFNAP